MTLLLVGFTHSNWASDPNHRKSTSRHVFSFGFEPITWDSQKQQGLTLFSIKAKYQATINASETTMFYICKSFNYITNSS